MLKHIASLALVLGIALSSTLAQAAEVPGKVIYKMPSGELVRRDVTLDVPPRGEGKVVWKTANYRVESHAFKTKKHLGRTIFSVLFLNVPGAPEGTAMALVGSYLRGSNEVIYYGDIYGKHLEGDSSGNSSPDSMLDELLQSATFQHEGESDWHYAGGFKFGKSIGK